MDINQLIDSQYKEAVQYFSKLNLPSFDGKFHIIDGSIEVIDVNNFNWGTFDVRIKITSSYPKILPILEETSGQIPRLSTWDWHVGENGECCVGTPAQQFRAMSGKITLLNWLSLFVVPFFANFIYKRDLKRYVNGEFSHGINGIIEDYRDYYKLQSVDDIVKRLSYLIGLYHPMNQQCFCGSGKLYKRCYLINKERHFDGVPVELIISDLRRIKKLILKQV